MSTMHDCALTHRNTSITPLQARYFAIRFPNKTIKSPFYQKQPKFQKNTEQTKNFKISANKKNEVIS